jgi:hypothetical protein
VYDPEGSEYSSRIIGACSDVRDADDLCGAASMGFGGLNEVVEFFLTLTLPETNIGGYINTGWDLVSNLGGVTAACCLIAWRHREVQ